MLNAEERSLDGKLWIGMLLGPLAAGINTIVGFTVAHWINDVGRKRSGFLVSAIDFALCIVCCFDRGRCIPPAIRCGRHTAGSRTSTLHGEDGPHSLDAFGNDRRCGYAGSHHPRTQRLAMLQSASQLVSCRTPVPKPFRLERTVELGANDRSAARGPADHLRSRRVSTRQLIHSALASHKFLRRMGQPVLRVDLTHS